MVEFDPAYSKGLVPGLAPLCPLRRCVSGTPWATKGLIHIQKAWAWSLSSTRALGAQARAGARQLQSYFFPKQSSWINQARCKASAGREHHLVAGCDRCTDGRRRKARAGHAPGSGRCGPFPSLPLGWCLAPHTGIQALGGGVIASSEFLLHDRGLGRGGWKWSLPPRAGTCSGSAPFLGLPAVGAVALGCRASSLPAPLGTRIHRPRNHVSPPPTRPLSISPRNNPACPHHTYPNSYATCLTKCSPETPNPPTTPLICTPTTRLAPRNTRNTSLMSPVHLPMYISQKHPPRQPFNTLLPPSPTCDPPPNLYPQKHLLLLKIFISQGSKNSRTRAAHTVGPGRANPLWSGHITVLSHSSCDPV